MRELTRDNLYASSRSTWATGYTSADASRLIRPRSQVWNWNDHLDFTNFGLPGKEGALSCDETRAACLSSISYCSLLSPSHVRSRISPLGRMFRAGIARSLEGVSE